MANSKAEQGDRQSKAKARELELLVRVFDVGSLTWSVLSPLGDAPPARGGHSVRLCLPPANSLAVSLVCGLAMSKPLLS